MNKTLSLTLKFILTITMVVFLSFLSTKIWSEKREIITTGTTITLTAEMTPKQISQQNKIPLKVIKSVFQLSSKDQLNQPVNLPSENIDEMKINISKAFALYEENSTKNWFKIPLKFIIWFIFMGGMFYLLRKKKLNPKLRLISYLAGFAIFGIILGADPSPMGTVKDAIALWGEKQVIFKPRMVALAIFMGTVILVNKMICSWGCQFGALQDFLFRLNRNKKDSKGLVKQYKIPFVLSNGFRIIFFLAFVAMAFWGGHDIVSDIDPFKIFKPQYFQWIGISFVAVISILSLLVYRPWCHLFCPFGLVGWFFEKLAWFKIAVDYNKCDACGACEKACPSYAMEAILRQDKVIPDCFACGTCIEVCPDDAISLVGMVRQPVPADHFDKSKRAKNSCD